MGTETLIKGGGGGDAPVYFQMEMYYTESEIRIMTAAYETLIQCGWEHDDAWDESYQVLYL